MEKFDKINIEEIKTGDIILTSGASWLSRAIQKFQSKQKNNNGSYEYSHSGIARWQDGTLFITEAQKGGICNNNFAKRYMNKNYKSLMVLKCKLHVDAPDMVREMMPFIGNTKYDFFDLLVAQPIKILTNGKVWIGEKKQNDRKFICHEWTMFVYNRHFENTGQVIFPNELKGNSLDIYNSVYFEKYLLK